MNTKTKVITLVLTSITIISLAMLPAISAKTTTLAVGYNQAQFQWRASASAIGDWTPSYSYLEYATSSDFKLTGNVLHMNWSYSPDVTDLEGQSTVYVYNKKADLWIEKEGQVSYKYIPGYGDYQIVNFFRGYMEFDGEPSEANFVHGVAYQWVYLLAPEDAETLPLHDVWDEKVGAWLVGFSIYLWDPTPQSYDLEFPDPFIEPVPANNYNPLDL